jgi:hypothetical protein
MIRPLLLAVAALAIAAPAASAHDDDAEIFATNTPAVITDQNDPRLDAPLLGFARRVEDIIRDGGARPRGSRLLDGVFFDSGLGSTTFERSRVFDVDHVSDDELHGIVETVRRRFLQGSVSRSTRSPAAAARAPRPSRIRRPSSIESASAAAKTTSSARSQGSSARGHGPGASVATPASARYRSSSERNGAAPGFPVPVSSSAPTRRATSAPSLSHAHST